MHIEFGHLLHRAIISALASIGDAATVAAAPGVRAIPKTEPCPVAALGLVTSPVCFELSTYLAAHNIEQLPSALARTIVSYCDDGEFTVAVGGDGYVNGTPTADFRRAFVARVAEKGVASLCCEESLLQASSLEIPELRPAIDGAKIRARAEDVASRDENVDLSSFLSTDGSTTGVGLLQLIAMLGDPEIEAAPFAENLGGSQNVPWYVVEGLRAIRAATAAASTCGTANGEDVRLLGTDLLLSFRQFVYRPLYRNRPEQAITAIRSGMQRFFQWYNCPDVRADLPEFDRDDVLPLQLWGEAVGQVLGELGLLETK